jgi:hypothetical protein
MAVDAGFAVALTVRESLLNKALLLAYTTTGFPSSLKFPIVGTPDASVDVFIGPPRVTCADDNSIRIALRLWGALSVTINEVASTRRIDGRLEIRLKPTFEVSGTALVLRPRSESDVTVSQWTFTVIAGGEFPPNADTYLRSSFFRDRLQDAVHLGLSSGLIALPRVDITFLRGVLDALEQDKPVKARVRQGAVLIGLDIKSFDTTIGGQRTTISLIGDIDILVDFARNNDLASVTNAQAIPLFLKDVDSRVASAVSSKGGTLEQFSILPETGRFRVRGVASSSLGSARFSFAIVLGLFAMRPGAVFQGLPKQVRVNTRTWPALTFSTADINVDVQASWKVTLIEVIGAAIHPATAFIIQAIIDNLAKEFRTKIVQGDGVAPTPRVRRSKADTPGAPTVRLAIEEYEITDAGTYIGITLQLESRPAALDGVTSIPQDLRAQLLRYTLSVPLGVRTDDPALRLRWSIVDLGSGTALVNEDDVAADRTTFEFVPQVVAPGVTTLGVGCRVYRALGAEITEVLNDGIELNIGGPLPSAAYVRWFFAVKNPQTRFNEKEQEWHYVGEAVVRRHSNLHRTDRPCMMEPRSSRYISRTDFFDRLPFAVANIALHRLELCDYCFYGGPAGMRASL